MATRWTGRPSSPGGRPTMPLSIAGNPPGPKPSALQAGAAMPRASSRRGASGWWRDWPAIISTAACGPHRSKKRATVATEAPPRHGEDLKDREQGLADRGHVRREMPGERGVVQGIGIDPLSHGKADA